jgi:hypothetical protein
MKKAAIALAVIAALAVGGAAYAHQWGGGPGWFGGGAGGYGQGCGPQGYGPGPRRFGPMMRGAFGPEDQKLLDETADLRREAHAKRFELREALRKGEYEKAEAIDKELDGIEGKLSEKLQPLKGKRSGRDFARRGGYGPGYGQGYGCPGPCGQ